MQSSSPHATSLRSNCGFDCLKHQVKNRRENSPDLDCHHATAMTSGRSFNLHINNFLPTGYNHDGVQKDLEGYNHQCAKMIQEILKSKKNYSCPYSNVIYLQHSLISEIPPSSILKTSLYFMYTFYCFYNMLYFY